MKIAIASDVHLEFGELDLKNDQGADVLILSGDILVETDLTPWSEAQAESGFMPDRSLMFHRFMQQCGAEFKHIVYVAGNHEHYHGDYHTTLKSLKEKLGYIDNLHILDKECFTYEDITFIGGTLWTDMNKEDPLTIYNIKRMMNDFRCVQNSGREATYRDYLPKDKPVGMTDAEWLALPIESRETVVFKTRPAKFSPEDAVDDHKKMLQYIQTIIEGKFDQKFVVVGHHAPSRQSTHPRYAGEDLMNGGYSSSLDEYIIDHPQIKLWTHGHTHDEYDYMIGSTRIVCNPRGYIHYEDRADNFMLKVVEV